MNILESQVTDLNYLVESPLATSVSMSGQRQSSSAESPDAADGGMKRKAGDPNTNGATQTRAKRNRYISIACNECKRRKIKCNGNTPCQRCGNLKLECQYAPNCCGNGFKESEEFRRLNAQIASLQEQVDSLYANLNALRNDGGIVGLPTSSGRPLPISEPSIPQPSSPEPRYRPTSKHASFRGPSSSAFGLDVAKTTLHNMGYQGLDVDEGQLSQDPTPIASPIVQPRPPPSHTAIGDPDGDPLWAFSKEEMIRLCRVWGEEVGLMYPVLDVEPLIIYGSNLYDFFDSALKSGLRSVTRFKGLRDEQSCDLKLVLAISSLLEGNGKSEIGHRLFDSVKGVADQILHSETFDAKSLPFLVLVAMYHFHCDEEALAWRIIGQVARMCIELGLHRRDSLFKTIADKEERSNAVRLFWTTYCLDRRWSFGTGMPFAIQDADIDPNLPEPEMHVPYLNVMITYSRIGSKVWRSISSFAPAATTSVNTEEIGYLDYQILQWQKTTPLQLQLPIAASPQASSRGLRRLQILLYLRTNQMRMLIYRPVLHSANSIQEHLSYATTVVEVARDTIRALTHLNQTTDIYRTQQVCFNYFLISAIAVIFLASCHAPVTFSSLCREEFYMALDLVKGLSGKSFVTRRLWKTIKGLKEVGLKLGLSADGISNGTNTSMEDPHSSAALAMAGLAGHDIPELGNAFMQEGMTGSGNTPMTGFQMSHEMTSLFEAALGNVGFTNGTNGGYPQINGDVGSSIFGGDEQLYRQMRDLF